MKFISNFPFQFLIFLLSFAFGFSQQAGNGQGGGSYEQGTFDYNFKGNQTQFIINYDRKNTQIRSVRVKIALEVNKKTDLDASGNLDFYFGEDPNSLTKTQIGTISSSDLFNLKTFYFEKNGLTPNTNYYFKWIFNSNLVSSSSGIISIKTPTGFAILPDQLYDIPEEGLKAGDTIGRIRYDDNGNKWKKIETYYKTSIGMKEDGSVWVWGNNTYSLIPGYHCYSNTSVVYDPVRAGQISYTMNLDSDGDGYLDLDEDFLDNSGNPQSNKNDPNSKPKDSDNYQTGISVVKPSSISATSTSSLDLTTVEWEAFYFKLSDIWEEQIGANPLTDDSVWSVNQSKVWCAINEFRREPLIFKDFTLAHTSVYGILENGDLWHWGNGSGGNNLDEYERDFNGDYPGGKISRSMAEKNGQWTYYYSPWYIGRRFKKKLKIITSSDNFQTPKYANLFNNENWYDHIVATITEDGDLYAWGQINGVVINQPFQLGSNKKWKDVQVSDGILALAEDGTMHQLAMEIFTEVPTSSIDTDNDGVPDLQDAFKYNSRFQYDSDEDGIPNKEEILMGTDPNNEHSDGDNVPDGEDAFPLDPNYSKDDDEDGVPYKNDFYIDNNGNKIYTDDNWDRDGDGFSDGEDADPNVSGSEDLDFDGDGISNVKEWEQRTDAWNKDTDGDGVDDKQDKFPNSYFYNKDSDGDGLPDALEIENGTNYLNPQTDWDSDGDGVKDGIKRSKFDYFRNKANNLERTGDWRTYDQYYYFWKFWELKYDCNGDGRVSFEEWERTSSDCSNSTSWQRDDFPTDSNKTFDTDGDGLDDSVDEDDDNDGYKDIYEEFVHVENGVTYRVDTDPKSSRDTPRDGKDRDHDRVPDLVERFGIISNTLVIYQKGTDPDNVNSDEDWAWDGWDDWPLDPNLQHDLDRDKLEDWVEGRLNTDPTKRDTDGDGVPDGEDAFPALGGNFSQTQSKTAGTKDTDGDGLSDEYEDLHSNIYDKNKGDTDGDGYWDCECDPNKFIFYTDFYGDSYWTDNWRFCNGEIENAYISDVSTSTLQTSYKTKFLDAGIKTLREILDLDVDKIIQITGLTGNNTSNDAYEIMDKIRDFLWGTWTFDINTSEWVNSYRIVEDKFPGDASEWFDFDRDGTGDNSDTDIDGDGYANDVDMLDYDPTEHLNTDAPTIANGGLKDYNGNGIYGEDADGDGWYEEVDLWNFDFIGNNKDMDDDADKYLDVDEIASGTDPLDATSYPGSGFGDSDYDGLSNNYEKNISKTNPNDWDSDNDGISDGWRYPSRNHNQNKNWEILWAFPTLTSTTTTNIGDKYWIRFEPDGGLPWITVSITTSTTMKGSDLLNYFKGQLSNNNTPGSNGGVIQYKKNSQTLNEYYTVTVSGTTLKMEGWTGDSSFNTNRDFYYRASVVLPSGNNKIVPVETGVDTNNYHDWKSDIYDPRRGSRDGMVESCCANWYGFSKGSTNSDLKYARYFMDMFPNDPKEYWDSDGDGIGDNSDSDIDGDGTDNATDKSPYDPKGAQDFDNDGYPDYLDYDDDNDGYWDIDESSSSVNSNPKDSSSRPSGGDSDGDGFSDLFEQSRGSNPNKIDSDGDGVSDGWKHLAPNRDDAWTEYIQIPNATLQTKVGETFKFKLSNLNLSNSNDSERIHSVKITNPPLSGYQLLIQFRDFINSVGSVNNEVFSAVVSNVVIGSGGTTNTIILSGPNGDTSRDTYYEASLVLVDENNKLYVQTEFEHSYHNFKKQILEPRKVSNNCCWQFAYDGYTQRNFGEGAGWLYDMFPTNPNEFWDSDGDGTGDNSDYDLDGDNTNNSSDDAPFDSSDTLDTDKDGISDKYDPNDDGDNFLDIDDPNPKVVTPNDGGSDADLDGYSDYYEVNVLKTDPNDWDSDDDGITDGWKFPSIDYSQNWRFVITTVVSTSLNVEIGQNFELRLWDHDNWDGGKEINFEVKTSMTALDVLNNLRDRINSLGRITLINGNSETFSASVNNNRLTIQGNDTNRNIGIEASESITTPENKVIFTRRSGKWDQINRLFYSPRLSQITDNNYEKYFYIDGEIRWTDAGGQLLMDQFPNNANEFWDTDKDGVGDNTDTDDDGDTWSDSYELTPKGEWQRTTNPLKVDSDGDGLNDNLDPIPFEKSEKLDTDGDWLGDENEDWDDDNDGLMDGFEKTTSSTDPDSDDDGYSDGRKGLFKSYDDKGNWQTVIKLLPTYQDNRTGLNEKYSIYIEGWNKWNNRIEIKFETSTKTYKLNDILTFFRDEINNKYSKIPFEYCCPSRDSEELISATISGTSLFIKGKDKQKNVYIDLGYGFARNYVRAITNDWWHLNQDQFPNDPLEWHDNDHDGTGDNEDENDDRDSISDKDELLLGLNPYSYDSDGDWYSDSDDEMPLDPSSRTDTDGDGIPDERWSDKNGDGRYSLSHGGSDGYPIIVDTDIDGDGISNADEDRLGLTDKYRYDSDNDGYHDGIDLFPKNPNAHSDFDKDGFDDKVDIDDDNDGFSDKDEIYNKKDPKNSSDYPQDDLDQDFMSDLYESYVGTKIKNKDTDGDGYNDGVDVFPLDVNEWIDSDADGEGNNQDMNDDNDDVTDFWEKIGIENNIYTGTISTTTWEPYEKLIGAKNSLLKDSDNDRIPDTIEKKVAKIFQLKFQNGDSLYRRAVWRAHEGIRNWDDPDNDGKRNYGLYTPDIDMKSDNDYDEDADGDTKKDEINALEKINFNDWDDDGKLNWEDDHSDDANNNNQHDQWDHAPFDIRDSRDLDEDFIGDNNDNDRDDDTLHNDIEHYKGSDPYKKDTDNDGTHDGLDYYAHDPRFQSKGQYKTSNEFKLKQIGTSSNWESISSWNYGQVGSSSAAVNNNGELFVWGMNYGSLPFLASAQSSYNSLPLERAYTSWNNGISDAFTVINPVRVRENINWKKVSLGNSFGLGVDVDNKIYSWGRNLSSQLGLGKPTTFVNFTSPNLLLGDIEYITAGDQQAGIINIDGKLRMIGSNDQGQLGTGASPFNYPRELDWSEIQSDIKKVRVTFTETQILDSNGNLWAYGDNDSGQLGRGIANTAAENFIAKKVTDVKGQEYSSSNNWKDIYAVSQQVYAFKLENNKEYLYAWGNNENYALGINKPKSAYTNNIPYEPNPVKVEMTLPNGTSSGISKDQILVTDGELQFAPLNGGFIFIKKNQSPGDTSSGELWGVGENFYTGRYNKYKSPTKIGNDKDWIKIHDLRSAVKNILLKKKDGSTWGAGDNTNKTLTNDPCPDPQTDKEEILITTKRQKQIFELELSSAFQGTGSLTIQIGNLQLTAGVGSITQSTIGSSTFITRVSTVTTNVSSVVSQFNTIINNDNWSSYFNITPSTLGNGNYKYRFEAKDYANYSNYFTISNKSDVFSGTATITNITNNISGEITYYVIVNGTEITKTIGSDNSLNDIQIQSSVYTEIKTKLQDKNIFNYPFNIVDATKTIGGQNHKTLLIERTDFLPLDVKGYVKNSNTSSATVQIFNIQENNSFTDDCNDNYPFFNKLVQIFSKNEYNWKKISLAKNHVVALTVSGTIYTWGARNNEGQLGHGQRNNIPGQPGEPKIVDSVSSTIFIDVSASENISFAVASDGKMYGWGDNDLGSLGDSTNTDRMEPTLVKSSKLWDKILGGHKFQVALTRDNKVYGWGYQKYGDLGALGKVKSDIVSITSDLSESKEIFETDPGGEFIIATQMLENYLTTMLNFENYGGGQGSNQWKRKQTVQKVGSKSSETSKGKSNKNSTTSKRMNVGKWKVKKKGKSFSGVSAISSESQLSSANTPYDFDIVDVNEKPTDIILNDITSKLTSKSNDQFISNITMVDPDQDDILTASIPTNSQNHDRFNIKNQKLYFNNSTSKALVPYNVTIRATDWEGRLLEKVFEILVDDSGNLTVEDVTPSVTVPDIYDSKVVDSDGDGFVDYDEYLIGTDPFDFRSFPVDFDNDGILDFYDSDTDNDGYLNEDDSFPFDKFEWDDNDNDGIGDNIDSDDDNDGALDIDVNWRDKYIVQDLFPNDPNESSDFDRDGIGDNADLDDDNDGYADNIDLFPNNPYEWLDTDSDGIGDNSDTDADNDGFTNFDETFSGTDPLNPNDYPSDLDGDFVPDLIDSDIDGDQIPNDFDNAPLFYNPDQEFIEENNEFILVKSPEFFSPNGDGINDLWKLNEIQRYPNNEVFVYDSDGNLVFSKKGYINDWNGTKDGQNLPKGSYLYVIDLDGNGSIDEQGWLYLIR